MKKIFALAGLFFLLASCGDTPAGSLSLASGSNAPVTSASNGTASNATTSTQGGGSVAPVSIADQHFSLKEFSDYGIFGTYSRFVIALHPSGVIDIDYVYKDKASQTYSGSQSYTFALKEGQSVGGVSRDLLLVSGVTAENDLQGPIVITKAYFFYKAGDAEISYQSEEAYSENGQSYGLITATFAKA